MEFFRIKRDIPFMRYALIFNVISIITFLVAIGSIATRGLNFGVDFTGGTVMEVNYAQPADLDKVREALARLGLSEVSVQNFGTTRDVLIRLPVKQGVTSAKLSLKSFPSRSIISPLPTDRSPPARIDHGLSQA